MRVLIVEDDATNRAMLERALRSAIRPCSRCSITTAFEVHSVTTAADARIRLSKAHAYDFVLYDIMVDSQQHAMLSFLQDLRIPFAAIATRDMPNMPESVSDTDPLWNMVGHLGMDLVTRICDRYREVTEARRKPSIRQRMMACCG